MINTLTQLPAERHKQDAILDSAQARPGPEGRKPLTGTARKVETAAAMAAAWIGVRFSSSENATLGSGTTFDENTLFEQGQQPARVAQPNDPAKAPPEAGSDAAALVPWVHVNN